MLTIFFSLQEIHKKGNVPGVVLTPIMFEEDVRSSMIYKMYKMDLFNFLGIYCRKHCVAGVPESMAVVWLAQLLSSLRVSGGFGGGARSKATRTKPSEGIGRSESWHNRDFKFIRRCRRSLTFFSSS